jgi:hypothetical protein
MIIQTTRHFLLQESGLIVTIRRALKRKPDCT